VFWYRAIRESFKFGFVVLGVVSTLLPPLMTMLQRAAHEENTRVLELDPERHVLLFLCELHFQIGNNSAIYHNEPIWLSWTPAVSDRIVDPSPEEVRKFEELKAQQFGSKQPL
jgi:hypothetical protein